MKRGRNKTPAERALELICAKANLSYEEFIVLVEKSQGEKSKSRKSGKKPKGKKSKGKKS